MRAANHERNSAACWAAGPFCAFLRNREPAPSPRPGPPTVKFCKFLSNEKEYTETVDRVVRFSDVYSKIASSTHCSEPVRVKDYLELTKPRITWLIVMSTAVGYYFGHSGPWAFWSLLHTLFGTALVASGTAALNQWYERDADRQMKRTQLRPLPAGRLTPDQALWFGISLALIGGLELGFGANWLTAILGIMTLMVYLFLYTPLKQKTWWSTTVGAIPGAMPPLIGFAGAAGKLTPEAWVLGAILFLWQFPHFYAIAWMYREDYSRAGIRMLPVVEPDGESTARQIIIYATLLIPVSLLPKWMGMTGSIYMVGALALGLLFLYSGVKVSLNRTRLQARRVLLTSVVYLPLLYVLMVVDPIRL
jgi:protoheme IX farnesyltransferase